MSDPIDRAQCCGKRPDKTRGVSINELPDLFPLLKQRPTEPGTWRIVYDCTACGQLWEEHLIPFMHADVHVVVKQGVIADLEDPRPPSPPPEPVPPESPEVGHERRGRRILLACMVAGIVVGFSTPPVRSDATNAVGDHRLYCFFSCFSAGVLINFIRDQLKR